MLDNDVLRGDRIPVEPRALEEKREALLIVAHCGGELLLEPNAIPEFSFDRAHFQTKNRGDRRTCGCHPEHRPMSQRCTQRATRALLELRHPIRSSADVGLRIRLAAQVVEPPKRITAEVVERQAIWWILPSMRRDPQPLRITTLFNS